MPNLPDEAASPAQRQVGKSAPPGYGALWCRILLPEATQGAELKKIYTLGYEGASVPDFIGTLQSVGVSLLLDVRELPQSRRPGFSKRVLSEALEEAGITYRHMKQLGDPKPGREAARRGDMDSFRAIFGAHIDTEASRTAIGEAAGEVRNGTVALMCFERAPKDCHRSIVADRIRELVSADIVHLGVQPGARTGE